MSVTYVWEKYTVKLITEYKETSKSGQTLYPADFTTAKTSAGYTFDRKTGIFTLTPPIVSASDYTTFCELLIAGYQHFQLNGDTSRVNRRVSVTTTRVQYTRYTASAYTAKSKGNYIENITSTNLNEYPTDGEHTDGYWYVFVGEEEEKRNAGYVNIRGVMRRLTGEGYVNKNGVLYPITLSSKVAINGVLKPLLIGKNPSGTEI